MDLVDDFGMEPTAKFCDKTSHKIEFRPFDIETMLLSRPKICKVTDSFEISNGIKTFDSETTQSNDYRRKDAMKREAIVQKENGIIFSQEKNDMKTTHHDAFPRRELTKTLPFLPTNNRESLAALDTATTTKTDFINFGQQKRCVPFLPISNQVASTEKMASTTSYLDTHTAKPVKPLMKPEWGQRKPYEPPVKQVPDMTTYKESFYAQTSPRPSPKKYHDNDIFKGDNDKLRTQYTNAFTRNRLEKRSLIKHADNLSLSTDKFQGLSSYKDHYNDKPKTLGEISEKYSKLSRTTPLTINGINAKFENQQKPTRLTPLSNSPTLPAST